MPNRIRVCTLLLTGSLLTAGCDVPTEPPILEQTWAVPLPETSITAADVAPSFLIPVSGGFEVAVSPVVSSTDLGTLCGAACDALSGLAAPVPSFSTTIDSNFDLPAGLNVARVGSAAVNVSVTNNLGFDPTENGGTISLEVLGPGGAVVASTTFDTSQGLPSGTSLQAPFPIGSIDFAGQFRAVVNVPGGQTALIDPSGSLSVSAAFTSLIVTGGELGSINEAFSFGPETFESDLGDEVLSRLESGVVELIVANPWGVSVNGVLTLGPISKSIVIPSGASSTVRLDFSRFELQQLFGFGAFNLAGSATATGTSVEIDVADALSLKPTFFIVIRS